MLNKGVLALHVPILGSRRFMLTKTLEWNLRWGLLDHMLDDRTFTLRPDFVSHPDHLARRFRFCPRPFTPASPSLSRLTPLIVTDTPLILVGSAGHGQRRFRDSTV